MTERTNLTAVGRVSEPLGKRLFEVGHDGAPVRLLARVRVAQPAETTLLVELGVHLERPVLVDVLAVRVAARNVHQVVRLVPHLPKHKKPNLNTWQTLHPQVHCSEFVILVLFPTWILGGSSFWQRNSSGIFGTKTARHAQWTFLRRNFDCNSRDGDWLPGRGALRTRATLWGTPSSQSTRPPRTPRRPAQPESETAREPIVSCFFFVLWQQEVSKWGNLTFITDSPPVFKIYPLVRKGKRSTCSPAQSQREGCGREWTVMLLEDRPL